MASGVIKHQGLLKGRPYQGDLNLLITAGTYQVSSDDTTHYPSDMTGIGNLLVIETFLVHQVLFLGNSKIYLRRYYGGSWSDWKKTELTAIT